MRLLPCGDAAVLVELDGLDEVLGLHAALIGDPFAGLVDLVPAARTLLVRIDPTATTVADAVRSLRQVRPASAGPRAVGRLEVPVRYDGPDLADVGRLTGLGEAGVVAAHTGRRWTVAFAGFAPGFAYLAGGDNRLRVPRRPTPRTRVPPGAVGLAHEFSGIYPRASPGGWQLIGRTALPMWDLGREPPALLEPGMEVQFVERS